MHLSLIPGYEDTLAMMQEIDRKNVKLCIDVPLFSDRQRTDYVREAWKNVVRIYCIHIMAPGTLVNHRKAM